MLPILKLAADGHVHTLSDAVAHAARELQLTETEIAEQIPSGRSRLYNRVAWSTTYLRKAQALKPAGPGRFQITDRGRDILAANPTALSVAFLESRFPEVIEFRRTNSAS